MKGKKGFTLIELMVVILIVAILAAVAIPMLRARIDRAKWSEANASCGTIWTAVRAYVAEKGPDYSDFATDLEGGLDDTTVMANLGFYSDDLSGTYFAQADYTLSGVSGSPAGCTVTVTSTAGLGPPGTGTFVATPGTVTWTIAP